jgi:hypothetical protein
MRGIEHHWRTWLPLVVSLVAVAFTGLQWWDTHRYSTLQVRPSVDFYTEDDDTEKMVGIAIENGGPGPAIIMWIKYFVDGKEQSSLDDALRRAKFDPDQERNVEYDEGDVLPVGKQEWLVGQPTKQGQALDPFIDFIDDHLTVQAQFCSIAGECSTKCSTKRRCGAVGAPDQPHWWDAVTWVWFPGLVLVGVIFYGIRVNWRLAYGLIEVLSASALMLGIAFPEDVGMILTADKPTSAPVLGAATAAAITLLASIATKFGAVYVFVRGLDNIDYALERRADPLLKTWCGRWLWLKQHARRIFHLSGPAQPPLGS